jgi:hypothetical protein
MRSLYKIVFLKCERKTELVRPNGIGRIILKWVLKNSGGVV